MAKENTNANQKNAAISILRKYLASTGVNIDEYAKERKILAEKGKMVSDEEGTLVRLSYEMPLARAVVAKKPEEILGAGLPERVPPVGAVIWPGTAPCDPEGFFNCFKRALQSQLQKVTVCITGPVHPGPIWNSGENAPTTVTVSNNSDVTWKNVNVKLHVSGPAYVVEVWYYPLSDDEAYWPVLKPGVSRSFYPVLHATDIQGTQDVFLYVSICGVPDFSKCTRTTDVVHEVIGT